MILGINKIKLISLIFILLIATLTRAEEESSEFVSPPNDSSPSEAELNQISENIDSQRQGNYGELQRRPAGPLGTQQDAWRNPRKTKGQAAPGIVRYSWSPSHVMSISLRDFMTTTLVFPKWENIVTFYVGDPYVFQADQAQPNILVLRSNNPGADTNFTAIGESGFVYNFYIRSESWNSSTISDFTVFIEAPNPTSYWARSTNPGMQNNGNRIVQSNLINASNTAENTVLYTNDGQAYQVPDYVRDILFKPEELKFDMKIYAKNPSDAEIAPERVFRDNQFTYFDYGDRADNVRRPVIYQVIDKIDTMVNTRTAGPNGNIIIAEGIGDFTLRNGNKIVCVKMDLKNEEQTKTARINKRK